MSNEAPWDEPSDPALKLPEPETSKPVGPSNELIRTPWSNKMAQAKPQTNEQLVKDMQDLEFLRVQLIARLNHRLMQDSKNWSAADLRDALECEEIELRVICRSGFMQGELKCKN